MVTRNLADTQVTCEISQAGHPFLIRWGDGQGRPGSTDSELICILAHSPTVLLLFIAVVCGLGISFSNFFNYRMSQKRPLQKPAKAIKRYLKGFFLLLIIFQEAPHSNDALVAVSGH